MLMFVNDMTSYLLVERLVAKGGCRTEQVSTKEEARSTVCWLDR